MLHLHGNADSAFSAWQVKHCEALRQSGFNVLDIDYRGFGLTPGHRSEAGMYEDAEAGYQELLRRGVTPDHIILLGHSLGSGPAVLLATRHKAAALVSVRRVHLDTGCGRRTVSLSAGALAASVQFNSLARIGEVHMPIVIAHSREDTLISYSHAGRLFAAANEPKHLITFDTSDDGFRWSRRFSLRACGRPASGARRSGPRHTAAAPTVRAMQKISTLVLVLLLAPRPASRGGRPRRPPPK